MKSLARTRTAAALLVGVAFAIWEGFQPWPSLAAHLSIPIAILAIFAITLLIGRKTPHLLATKEWLHHARYDIAHPTLHTLSVTGWILLSASVAGWDLNSFLARQHNLPTLSRLIGAVTHEPLGRMFFVLAWLALGLFFALGGKNPRTETNQ